MTKGNVAFANAVGEETVVTNSYEALGQNVEQKSHAGFSLYAYHPDSPLRRLHVKKDGEATAFLWDPQTQNNLEDIEVGSGATRATHQHGTGMDQLVGTEGPAGTRGYVTDALGSVRVVTDPVGNVTGRYGYSAYGEPRGEQESEGNRFRFTGREWEPESGLNFTRNRYYRPSCGCWVSADPIGFAGGMNLWGYVENNPATRRDPSGLQAVTKEEAAAGSVVVHKLTLVAEKAAPTAANWILQGLRAVISSPFFARDGPHAARDGAEVIWRQWTAGKKCVDEAGRRAIRVVWNRLLDKTLPKAERDFTTTAAWRIINPPPLSKQPAVPS